MFTVTLSSGPASERSWIVSLLFREFLRVPFRISRGGSDTYRIAQGDRTLTIPDVFLRCADADWLAPSTVPRAAAGWWGFPSCGFDSELCARSVPVLFGMPGFRRDSLGNGKLEVDVFGAAFFMLSRYEEAVLDGRDQHDRFPATESLADMAGFLDRPIVDEYVEILWSAMRAVWPASERKARVSRLRVSCDVDWPYSAYTASAPLTAKKMLGDLVKRKSPRMAVRTGLNTLFSRAGSSRFEPYDTFDWIMEINEAAGNRVCFNFMAGCTEPLMDASYSLDEPRIRALLRTIHTRGHEIGLHCSYDSYRSAATVAREFARLRTVLDEEGIRQSEIGNRQHYLRWHTPETARFLDAAGVAYDSTLGYADRSGFRCGTGASYPMFDLETRQELRIRQRPLVVMEDTVIDDTYLGLGVGEQALASMLTLRDRAMSFGGDFGLLWHNSGFPTPESRAMYESLIS